MSEFLIDICGNQIWYDLKSNIRDFHNGIWYRVVIKDAEDVFVRPHREDGAAIVFSGGTEKYFIKGKFHRDDGPAVIWPYDEIEWWLDDKEYYFEEWCVLTGKSNEEINFLKLKWNIL